MKHSKFKIGQKIKHGPAYGITCSDRFPSIYDDNFQFKGREAQVKPLFLSGESIIIGLKMAIMANYKYEPPHTSQGFEDSYAETTPGWASGKREECLVCVKDIKKFKPFLVRKQDIIPCPTSSTLSPTS